MTTAAASLGDKKFLAPFQFYGVTVLHACMWWVADLNAMWLMTVPALIVLGLNVQVPKRDHLREICHLTALEASSPNEGGI